MLIRNIIYYKILSFVIINFNLFSVEAEETNLFKSEKFIEIIKKFSESEEIGTEITNGISIYSLKEDKELYNLNSKKRLIPASNTKLFTAICAFSSLGKDYKFITSIISEKKISNNTLDASLYLIPSGDPSFIAEDLEYLIKNLADLGLKKLNGDFFILDTVFDEKLFAPGISVEDLQDSCTNPINSFVVDKKASKVSSEKIINFINNEELKNMFFDLNLALRNLFVKYNINFSGEINFCKQAPNDYNLLSKHESKSLLNIISYMLKESDNVYADCLFKKLASIKYKKKAGWNDGINNMIDFLESLDIGLLNGVKITDGSGVSMSNLISPSQIVSLFKWASNQNFYHDFIQSLAISGTDGTLKQRMKNISGKVFAKTGTLSTRGVSSLSGILKTKKNDEDLIISIINNGGNIDDVLNLKKKENNLCEFLYENY